ncbi:hypothetical protein K435DRAFT_811500 [Dendrothele bispora CBS 962.96]|uniref:Uncharacterized protein n=1 Tax=Dendrothele bispora (strain CBS 962.96) TaxID=1314807 RepID=A0A4S8KS32_DENBC|nr:hypothetical protein K435DRAFT_811500 [Dendrothele bispora CBS 962.96]
MKKEDSGKCCRGRLACSHAWSHLTLQNSDNVNFVLVLDIDGSQRSGYPWSSCLPGENSTEVANAVNSLLNCARPLYTPKIFRNVYPNQMPVHISQLRRQVFPYNPFREVVSPIRDIDRPDLVALLLSRPLSKRTRVWMDLSMLVGVTPPLSSPSSSLSNTWTLGLGKGNKPKVGELLRPPPPLHRPTTFWRHTPRSGVTSSSFSPSTHVVRRSTFVAAGIPFERPMYDMGALGVESRVRTAIREEGGSKEVSTVFWEVVVQRRGGGFKAEEYKWNRKNHSVFDHSGWYMLLTSSPVFIPRFLHTRTHARGSQKVVDYDGLSSLVQGVEHVDTT